MLERMPQFNPSDTDINETVNKLDEEMDVDAEFEKIAPSEKSIESKTSDAAAKAAMEAVNLMQKMEHASDKAQREALKTDLAKVKDNFLAGLKNVPGADKTQALAKMREWLSSHHEAYLNLGKKELASEIDSFGRSLEASSEVRTAAGKELLTKLNAGGFDSIESAINALDAIKAAAKGAEEEEINAEFNALYAAINEKFLGGQKEEKGPGVEISDKDVDDMFGGLN